MTYIVVDMVLLYRNAALILATQGLWKTYYNSSSGVPHEYFVLRRTGSAIYEAILILIMQ